MPQTTEQLVLVDAPVHPRGSPGGGPAHGEVVDAHCPELVCATLGDLATGRRATSGVGQAGGCLMLAAAVFEWRGQSSAWTTLS